MRVDEDPRHYPTDHQTGPDDRATEPVDEVSVGEPAADEPAVGVASVPPPGSVPPPDSPTGYPATPFPATAGDGDGTRDATDERMDPDDRVDTSDRVDTDDERADVAASTEADRAEAEADRAEAAAEREEAAARETPEPYDADRPSDAELMTAAATPDVTASDEARDEAVRDEAEAREEEAREEEAREEETRRDEPAVEAASAVEAEAAGEEEAVATGPAEAEELAPGEVPLTTTVVLWEAEVIDDFRDRWQQIQLRFIDDPRRAAEQARVLSGDVCEGLADALTRHRGELDRWRSAQLDDTEELRMAVRRYRDLLERLFTMCPRAPHP